MTEVREAIVCVGNGQFMQEVEISVLRVLERRPAIQRTRAYMHSHTQEFGLILYPRLKFCLINYSEHRKSRFP
jgi:hypothetical protein